MQNLIATSTCDIINATTTQCVYNYNSFIVDSVSSILLSLAFILSFIIISTMLNLFHE